MKSLAPPQTLPPTVPPDDPMATLVYALRIGGIVALLSGVLLVSVSQVSDPTRLPDGLLRCAVSGVIEHGTVVGGDTHASLPGVVGANVGGTEKTAIDLADGRSFSGRLSWWSPTGNPRASAARFWPNGVAIGTDISWCSQRSPEGQVRAASNLLWVGTPQSLETYLKKSIASARGHKPASMLVWSGAIASGFITGVLSIFGHQIILSRRLGIVRLLGLIPGFVISAVLAAGIMGLTQLWLPSQLAHYIGYGMFVLFLVAVPSVVARL